MNEWQKNKKNKRQIKCNDSKWILYTETTHIQRGVKCRQDVASARTTQKNQTKRRRRQRQQKQHYLKYYYVFVIKFPFYRVIFVVVRHVNKILLIYYRFTWLSAIFVGYCRRTVCITCMRKVFLVLFFILSFFILANIQATIKTVFKPFSASMLNVPDSS